MNKKGIGFSFGTLLTALASIAAAFIMWLCVNVSAML
jgi:hypothetical protein